MRGTRPASPTFVRSPSATRQRRRYRIEPRVIRVTPKPFLHSETTGRSPGSISFDSHPHLAELASITSIPSRWSSATEAYSRDDSVATGEPLIPMIPPYTSGARLWSFSLPHRTLGRVHAQSRAASKHPGAPPQSPPSPSLQMSPSSLVPSTGSSLHYRVTWGSPEQPRRQRQSHIIAVSSAPVRNRPTPKT